MGKKKTKKRGGHQPGTTRVNQDTDQGLTWLSLNVHNGRVTKQVHGPASDNYAMALELFRSHLRNL